LFGVLIIAEMKVKSFFITLICVSLSSVCQGQTGNTPPPPLSLEEGEWQLDSILVDTGSKTQRLQGSLPQEVFYSCPLKIELRNESGCLLYFDNEVVKHSFYYVFTESGKNSQYLHFSFEGQGSTPEQQHLYIIERKDSGLLLKYYGSDLPGEASDTHYVYYYSIN
jgi:hypothetical protein